MAGRSFCKFLRQPARLLQREPERPEKDPVHTGGKMISAYTIHEKDYVHSIRPSISLGESLSV